jgi:hypothetical protein
VAMSQSMLLPALVSLFGVAAAVFMVGIRANATTWRRRRVRTVGTPLGPASGYDGRTETMTTCDRA